MASHRRVRHTERSSKLRRVPDLAVVAGQTLNSLINEWTNHWGQVISDQPIARDAYKDACSHM